MELSLGCFLTDRVQPILDGRVAVPGVALRRDTGDTATLFRRALRERALQATELSMASHILLTARGEAPYVGIPVFLSRAFRHGSIVVRTDRGIGGPADLAGRRIGLPEYQQTAALWLRGILREQHGVDTRAIAWRSGGLEAPHDGERVALRLPPGHDVQPIPAGATLNALLAAGELDAVVAPRAPSCLGRAPVAPLWPDARAAEERFHAATGFFPIMHLLTLRRDVAEAHPELPAALFHAFAAAKALALRAMEDTGVLRVTLPWLVPELAAQRARMGGAFWSYGFAANRAELAAMARFALADGLAERLVEPEELFHPSTLALAEG